MNPELQGHVVAIPIVIPDWVIALCGIVILALIALIVLAIMRRKQ
jgi:hypothetical protein